MSRNEAQTCHDIIEPVLRDLGWELDSQFVIGPGRVNITGKDMYDPSQRLIADYVLRLDHMPLAVLEAKAEGHDAADGMQQGSRYLYNQMKSRGTRLCEDIDKRYFTIFDHMGGSACEDAEWDGPPANEQNGKVPSGRRVPRRAAAALRGKKKQLSAADVEDLSGSTFFGFELRP